MRLLGAADAIRAEGARVVEVAEVDNVIHEGDTWKRRGHEYAAGGPTCVTWHHTAVDIPQTNILRFELYKYESTPGNNVNIGRDGTVYLLAAGSTATNGAGTQMQFSRGLGGKNSTTFTMEIHNDGRGQPYPQAQIDACFAVSNAINRLVGNKPTDLCTHHEYAEDRKTDPSTAGAVQGAWQPRACTSSGTWHHDDIRAEAVRRWSDPNQGEDDMPSADEVAQAVWHDETDNLTTGQKDEFWWVVAETHRLASEAQHLAYLAHQEAAAAHKDTQAILGSLNAPKA